MRIVTRSLLALLAVAASYAEKRPMTPLDVVKLRRLDAYSASPDGRWLLYAQSVMNWEKGVAYTDLFLASVDGATHRQLTFTTEAGETPFAWARDSASFAFLSEREGGKKQVHLMTLGGGEARRLTREKDGVDSFAFSRDGRWLAFKGGAEDHRQLKLIDLKDPEYKPFDLPKHETPVEEWAWHPSSGRLYFTAADRDESLLARRNKLGFDVKVNALEQAPRNLWAQPVDGGKPSRATSLDGFSATTLRFSRDGRSLAFLGKSVRRYATEWDREVFLVNLESGAVRRVTDNRQAESNLQFSPDSKWLAYTGPDRGEDLRAERILLVSTADSATRELLTGWDRDGRVGFWSPDSSQIYFDVTVGVAGQLHRVPVSGGAPEAITSGNHVLNVTRDDDSGVVLIRRSAPDQPDEVFTAPLGRFGAPAQWKRLTRLSEQVEPFQLGEYETIRWASTDGQQVEGLLIKPVGYREGQRYPLIVQVHGGPAGTSTVAFGGSYSTYPHVLAGRGFAVFQPNYRGSAGYGEDFRRQIAGDYFRLGFDDIMTGVDYLVKRGVADPDKLGHMGWSAGGHWSNWALTQTDRFKAIASGAGAVNWASMYAQTDVQPIREFYFRGTPYDNPDHYREVSPITYIKNARTPTLILCGADDPRVPNAQSRELYIALQRLGVPVEYIEFPGMPHGITKPRYQLVKMEAELAWFDKWILGKAGWLDWEPLLRSVPRADGAGN
ncbi:MAG: S9 family peptidase [Bryobacteraceae bacterium]|nr:S9 family peptidase [Bryobacteraceae bacterium]